MPNAESSEPGLRWLVAHSAVAGLTALLPVPIVDDWLRDLLRKRMAIDLGRRYGVELGGLDARVLGYGHRPATASGCVGGCLERALMAPLKFVVKLVFRKSLRKLLYFLAVKDAVDGFARIFDESYLLRHAFVLGALEGLGPASGETASPRAVAVRRAIEAAAAETDRSPVVRVAHASASGSRRVLVRAARAMGRQLRVLRRAGRGEEEIYESVEREGEAELGSLIDRLTAAVAGETDHLRRLEERLERHLGEAPTGPYPVAGAAGESPPA